MKIYKACCLYLWVSEHKVKMIECVSVKLNQLSHSISPRSKLSFQGIVETLKNFCVYFSKKIAISGWKENED
jgi:hypothetical protein